MTPRWSVVLVLAMLVIAQPVSAQEADQGPSGLFGEIRLIPADGVQISVNGKTYGGSVVVRGHSDGLAVIEELEPERYLLGLQEVPYSWHMEALRAQAVAARTYLAWTLARDRAGAAGAYGFDICATSACQVYGGLDLITGPNGSRWQEAVESTAGQVLLYEGEPALTLYFSTTGGSTSSIQDVYRDRDPVPYLTGVPSTGESSPFVEWAFDLRASQLEEILRESGELRGSLSDIEVTTRSTGQGPWTVHLVSEGGSIDLTTWEFRSLMNRWGPSVAPEILPALRADGRP